MVEAPTLTETNSRINRQLNRTEGIVYRDKSITFNGIEIAWDEIGWYFLTHEGSMLRKPVYSVWNPNHWPTIAEKLVAGERCAMQVAGAFGAGMIFRNPDLSTGGEESNNSQFAKLEEIKKGRPWKKNFVAFVHPHDQGEIIDFSRLAPQFKHLENPNNRARAYGWASHNIYPLREDIDIDPALIQKDDQSIACFWINGHWGFEGILGEVKKYGVNGFFGGGSLNFHQESPGFKKHDVYGQIAARPEWQKAIDFIILDDISEKNEIYRSQPMLSFMGEEAELIRHGSMSLGEIQKRIGYKIKTSDRAKYASSATQYSDFYNKVTDNRIARAERTIAAFRRVIKP